MKQSWFDDLLCALSLGGHTMEWRRDVVRSVPDLEGNTYNQFVYELYCPKCNRKLEY